jgi:glycosyltransferase involved in cell wall biosynthesis
LLQLSQGTIRVYGQGLKATVASAAEEAVTRPLRTIRTIFDALGDAIAPGEPTALPQRLKLIPQALAGIGLARQLRRQGVRHLHVHFAHSPASVAMYAARQLGIGFSFTGHANDLFQRRTLLRRKLERAKFVACISHWHESFYRSIAPSANTSYRVIRCGVDIEGWKPREQTNGDSQLPLRVLTVCRLVEKKGVDLLIRALCAMEQESGRQWRLTVAGDGPEEERLQALARELGCGDRIRWLGLVTNESIPALLDEAEVFVLPCRTDSAGDRDGIPVVLMEAMACGVAVASGDLPAIRELIEDGISGLLIPQPQSPAGIAALAAALSRLARDPALRHRLAAAGRRRVEEEFSMSRNIQVLEQSLRAAIVAQASSL